MGGGRGEDPGPDPDHTMVGSVSQRSAPGPHPQHEEERKHRNTVQLLIYIFNKGPEIADGVTLRT